MRLPKRLFPVGIILAAAAAIAFLAGDEVGGRQTEGQALRVGTSGTLGPTVDKTKAKAAMETLKSFIQDETRMSAEIIQEKNWRALADHLAQKKVQVGVFAGSEYAWATAKESGMKPLAVAVNAYRYPVVYAVANKKVSARSFADLKGQTLSIPDTGEDFLRLFVDSQVQAAGGKMDSFFSKVTTPANVEDAIDDAVDGKVQVTVADRPAFEAYKRRKPGRFRQLKLLARSQPFPPPVIARFDGGLDETRRNRFEQGLINSSKNEKGKLMLALFHLTGFEPVPDDFATVLEKFRKAYPAAKFAPK